ncbi:hypothetical protein [Aerococcus agrisoli]|uniref:hypothetical protein n=1 Tax=Aerococcus agrisoli TaxID=2487350 RepID=UPI001F2D1B04|nr:hypothetical protein [Aerococcus agrisoli]
MSEQFETVDLTIDDLTENLAHASLDLIDGAEVVRVVKDKSVEAFDEATFARINDVHFHNGVIKVKVLSRLLPDAPDFSRGFIGIAFRINDSNDQFEGLYIRPTNGRCDDQSRRNSATQYFSYPDYKFDRFRAENPKKYESYADMGLDEWIDLKIEVDEDHAKFFVNQAEQPVLIVNDLKLGPNAEGGVGLWVDVGAEGFFKDLQIEHYY